MAVLTIVGCTGCGACLLTCPTHALRPDGGRLSTVDGLCTRCGECVEVCPADAITIDDESDNALLVWRSGRLDRRYRA